MRRLYIQNGILFTGVVSWGITDWATLLKIHGETFFVQRHTLPPSVTGPDAGGAAACWHLSVTAASHWHLFFIYRNYCRSLKTDECWWAASCTVSKEMASECRTPDLWNPYRSWGSRLNILCWKEVYTYFECQMSCFAPIALSLLNRLRLHL